MTTAVPVRVSMSYCKTGQLFTVRGAALLRRQRRHVARAYAAALGCRYLWHEFGDLHLIVAKPRR